jgi:hypothetical protein
MDIESLTLREFRGIAQMFAGSAPAGAAGPGPWEIGADYIIRTVTMTVTGRLVAVHAQELVLEDAAWIADSGRWADALRTGEFAEVEPFPEGCVIVGRGAVVDACRLSTPLPRVQQ